VTLRAPCEDGKSRNWSSTTLRICNIAEAAPVEKQFELVYRGGLSERAGTFVLLRAVRC